MTKQLIALAIAAAFGVAHAADVKPAVAETRAATTPAAAVVKGEVQKAAPAVEAPKADVKAAEAAQPVEKKVKKAKKPHPEAPQSDAPKAEAAKPAEPAKK